MITPLHSDPHGKVKVMPMRDTAAQDRPIDPAPAQKRRQYQLIGAGAGALLLLIVLGLLIRNWISAEITVPIERVRIAEVTRGPFIRDISAQGTVVAAVSPTMFAAAPGTVHFLVQAGDVVTKDQPIATLESPELRNELEREQASLAGLEVAVQRQAIETRSWPRINRRAILRMSRSRPLSASCAAPRTRGSRR
jgi:HlyD family secretion protein